MNSKDKWISETMNSLQGLKPARSSEYLYSKILNRLDQKNEVEGSKKWLWLSMAAILVIGSLNIVMMVQFSDANKTNNSEIQEISSHYELLNTSTFNYN